LKPDGTKEISISIKKFSEDNNLPSRDSLSKTFTNGKFYYGYKVLKKEVMR